jgi:hypothetical protein
VPVATAMLAIKWTAVPKELLTLQTMKVASRAHKRASWTVVAAVRDPRRHPLRGELVEFELFGLPGSRLSHKRIRTGTNGTAQTTVSVPSGGAALVEAVTDNATITEGITITN